MDSFASTARQYDDGQNNREEIPAEIQQFGWKPPVKLPDGSIVEGDFLAANHLNQIFYDLYQKLKASVVITKEVITDAGGYQVLSNGDIEMWGSATTGSDGNAVLNLPLAMPGPTRDIQFTVAHATGNVYVTSLQPNSTYTAFTVHVVTPAGALASGVTILWRVKYHKPRSNGV